MVGLFVTVSGYLACRFGRQTVRSTGSGSRDHTVSLLAFVFLAATFFEASAESSSGSKLGFVIVSDATHLDSCRGRCSER